MQRARPFADPVPPVIGMRGRVRSRRRRTGTGTFTNPTEMFGGCHAHTSCFSRHYSVLASERCRRGIDLSNCDQRHIFKTILWSRRRSELPRSHFQYWPNHHPAINHTVHVTPDGFLAYGIARSDGPQDRFLRQYTTILGRYLPSLVTLHRRSLRPLRLRRQRHLAQRCSAV